MVYFKNTINVIASDWKECGNPYLPWIASLALPSRNDKKPTIFTKNNKRTDKNVINSMCLASPSPSKMTNELSNSNKVIISWS